MYKASQRISYAIRTDLHESLINQPLEFFDKKGNSTGELTGMLARDVKEINTVTIELYLILFGSFSCLCTGLIIATIYSNQIGLASILFFPLEIFCLYLHSVEYKSDLVKKDAFEGNFRRTVSDTVANHSTISSMGHEDVILQRYFQKEESSPSISRVLSICTSISLGDMVKTFYSFITIMI